MGCPATWCIFFDNRKQVLGFLYNWHYFWSGHPIFGFFDIMIIVSYHITLTATSFCCRCPPPLELACSQSYFCIHHFHSVYYGFDITLPGQIGSSLSSRSSKSTNPPTFNSANTLFLFLVVIWTWVVTPGPTVLVHISYLKQTHISAVLSWIFNRLAIFNVIVLSPFLLKQATHEHQHECLRQ